MNECITLKCGIYDNLWLIWPNITLKNFVKIFNYFYNCNYNFFDILSIIFSSFSKHLFSLLHLLLKNKRYAEHVSMCSKVIQNYIVSGSMRSCQIEVVCYYQNLLMYVFKANVIRPRMNRFKLEEKLEKCCDLQSEFHLSDSFLLFNFILLCLSLINRKL